MCHVTAPDVWGEHARTHLDLLFAPCCKWLVHHISNGKNLFFKFIFKIWYIITSPVIGRAQLLLIVTKKKKQNTPPHLMMWFPSSHWFFQNRPCHSAKSKATRQGSGLKKDRIWDSIHGAFYFKVWDSCGVLADCLLWKSLGYNRKT